MRFSFIIKFVIKHNHVIISDGFSYLSCVVCCLSLLHCRSGTIDIYEFSALWKYIQQWKQCFDRYKPNLNHNHNKLLVLDILE